MKQIILGTAGHIDHGKTSLIKALTGTDTDRLLEEKRRGITIELGFAALDLPGGLRVGVIDVPGHERFVKNMVAGATGIDVVAMVIAADEGVMPQTREHLNICSLLGVSHGLVALTKTDMVDEDWLGLVTEDVREFLKGSFLEDAPVVRVSAVTGQGLDDFKRTLDQICEKIPDQPPQGLFRLPVDRVFTMRGFGTVITGTIVSGKVALGDAVEIFPVNVRSKVRGLQVHNDSVPEAREGMRTAINFQGVDKSAVLRGNVVAMPGTLAPSYMVDISLTLLPHLDRPFKTRTLVRFHTGTSEVLGKVVLLGMDELEPGGSAMAQMRLETPVCLVKDDRFVIRGTSPVDTVGGGVVLNPVPKKHKSGGTKAREELLNIASASPKELVSLTTAAAGYSGASFRELLLMCNLPEKKLADLCQGLLSKKELVQAGREAKIFVHQFVMRDLEKRALDHLAAYHKANPLKPGMPKEELKSKFPSVVDPKVFHQMLEILERQGRLVTAEDLVRLAEHKAELAGEGAELEKKIAASMRDAGLMPPTPKDLSGTMGASEKRILEILTHMAEKKDLVKVKQDLFFDKTAIEDLRQRLVAYLKDKGEIGTPEFKDMTGASRKFVIPLIEYFDSQKVTLRIGDTRKLREGA
jgi:selenocysteine-specific elongation factor